MEFDFELNRSSARRREETESAPSNVTVGMSLPPLHPTDSHPEHVDTPEEFHDPLGTAKLLARERRLVDRRFRPDRDRDRPKARQRGHYEDTSANAALLLAKWLLIGIVLSVGVIVFVLSTWGYAR